MLYTHDIKLKRHLLAYATKFPELCEQTVDDGQGGLRFELDKKDQHPTDSIRLTASYAKARRQAVSELVKEHGIQYQIKQ